MVCINKDSLQKEKKALAEKGFSAGQLHKAFPNTQERVKFLTEQFGSEEQAKYYNNKYEKYLLNKQKEALKNWVKTSAKKGIDNNTKKSLLEKIDKLSKVLGNTSQDKPFLNGLVKQSLGFYITQDEANLIKQANDNIIESKRQLLEAMPDYLTFTKEEELEALKDVNNAKLVADLALRVATMKEIYDAAKIAADKAERIEKGVFKIHPKGNFLISMLGKETTITEALTTLAGNIKSLKATLDISWFRQPTSAWAYGLTGYIGNKEGARIFETAKKGWKEGWDTWKEVVKAKSAEDARQKMLLAEGLLMVRPNALNGNYARLGVAVGIQEEAYPESWAIQVFNKAKDKTGIPNFFLASEKGFNIAIQATRAEIADALIDMAGGDIAMLKEQNAGQFVNELTGRGKLPFNNPNAERAVNALLFAPRYLSSRIAQIYNLKYAGKWALNAMKGKETGMIDKMRAKSSMAQLALFAILIPAIKGILRAMDDDDPHGDDYWERFWSAYEMRTSDFGKIVLGDTRIDVSAGLDGLLTLSARVVTGKSVSISGVKRDKNWSDVLGSFSEGKLSPAARVVIDGWRYLTQEDPKNFMYQPITARGLLSDVFLPISVENLTELTIPTESKTAQIAGIVADIVGLGANTYGIADKDVGKSTDLKAAEFDLAWKLDRNPASITPAKSSSIMKKLSGARQEKAVADFSERFNTLATRLVQSAKYKRMTPEEQSKALTDVREQVNKEIKKKYGLK